MSDTKPALNRSIRNVRFLRSAGCYRTGDVAGFDADVGRKLVDQGLAEEFTAQPHPHLHAPGPEARRPVQQSAG